MSVQAELYGFSGVSASALQSSGSQRPLLNHDKRKSYEQLYKGIDELRREIWRGSDRCRYTAQPCRLIFLFKAPYCSDNSPSNMMPIMTHPFLAACRR